MGIRVLLAAGLLAWYVPQHAQAVECNLKGEVKRQKGPDYSLLKTDLFEIMASRPGKYGGRILTVKTKGPWSDFRQSRTDADAIIDMRVPIHVLREIAAFFGFKQIDDYTMEIPDAEALTGSINKFNEGLAENDPRRILISPEMVNKVFQPKINYYNRLLKHRRVAVSRRGRQFYHDLLAHAWIWFLVDNRIVHVMENRDKIMDSFYEFARQKLTPKELEELEIALRESKETTVGEFDNFGRISSTFIRISNLAWLSESAGKSWPKYEAALSHIPESQRQEIRTNSLGVTVTAATVKDSRWTPSILGDLPRASAAHWRSFRELMEPQHPDWFEPLPYDFNTQLREAADARAYYTKSDSEREWRQMPLANPFVLRLERARELIAKEKTTP